jgi:hypothetical protein
MLKHWKYFLPAFFSILMILIATSPSFSEEEAIIIGIITEDSQLVTDEGDVYDIAHSEKADELVKNLRSKAEVKGTIETDKDTGSKYIRVSSFKLIKE